MPKVAFLMPASPVRAFFAQIAAFSLALRRLNWHRWEPSLLVCMGGEPDTDGLRDWMPHLRDVSIMLIPAAMSEATPWYYAQIDALYRWAPADADVLVRVDADTLPVGDLEDVLDYVVETASIAGVIAHFRFPAWPGTSSRDAWLRVAQGLIDAPLDFAHSYTLTGTDVPEAERVTPFYLNDGVVFFSRAIFRDLSERYLALRPKLMAQLPLPYFSGQVALALAAADIGAPCCALPIRYNLPNDDLALARYPEEVEHVKILHYLRTQAFDRHRIFLDSDSYRAFLDTPLAGINEVFQRWVKGTMGEEYPFPAPPSHPQISTPPGSDRESAPLRMARSGTMADRIDQLVAELEQNAQIIAELKRALVAREKHINHLELAVAELSRGRQIPSPGNRATAAPQPPGALGLGRGAVGREPSHPLLPTTAGVYADLWTDVEAVLRFTDEVAGATLRLRFFVPPGTGEEAKRFTVSPNFADPMAMQVQRGTASSVEFVVPPGLAAPPEIHIQVEQAEPPTAADRRRLGIKIAAISIERTGVAPDNTLKGPR